MCCPWFLAVLAKRKFLAEKSCKEFLTKLYQPENVKVYEIYHGDMSPAKESFDRVKARAERPNRKYYFINKDGARVGVINLGHNDPDEKEISFISPLFIRPKYQNQGIGYVAIQKAFEMFPEVKIWKLDTIKQEARNCHLYEKCGFVRVGEEHVVNDKMTLVDYEYRVE